MLMASTVESLCTYSAQRRNAQIQFNATRTCASERIATQPLHSSVVGAGFIPHVGRNLVAMMGIRLFSPYSHEVVCQVLGTGFLSENGRLVASDLASSIVAATLSMPLNHMFSWAACSPELDKMGYLERAVASTRWLIGTYREQGMRLLARDLVIRINYTAFLFTGYRFVERSLVDLSRHAD
jgi:hypothetical protein